MTADRHADRYPDLSGFDDYLSSLLIDDDGEVHSAVLSFKDGTSLRLNTERSDPVLSLLGSELRDYTLGRLNSTTLYAFDRSILLLLDLHGKILLRHEARNLLPVQRITDRLLFLESAEDCQFVYSADSGFQLFDCIQALSEHCDGDLGLPDDSALFHTLRDEVADFFLNNLNQEDARPGHGIGFLVENRESGRHTYRSARFGDAPLQLAVAPYLLPGDKRPIICAFQSYPALRIAYRHSNDIVQVATEAAVYPVVVPGDGCIEDIHFNKDGRLLVLVSNHSAGERTSSIFRVELESLRMGNIEEVYTGAIGRHSIAPNGSYIALVDSACTSEIVRLDVSGNALTTTRLALSLLDDNRSKMRLIECRGLPPHIVQAACNSPENTTALIVYAGMDKEIGVSLDDRFYRHIIKQFVFSLSASVNIYLLRSRRIHEYAGAGDIEQDIFRSSHMLQEVIISRHSSSAFLCASIACLPIFTFLRETTAGAVLFNPVYSSGIPSLLNFSSKLGFLFDRSELRSLYRRCDREVLVVHGGRDAVAPVHASNEFSLSSRNVTLQLFEDEGHIFSKPENWSLALNIAAAFIRKKSQIPGRDTAISDEVL